MKNVLLFALLFAASFASAQSLDIQNNYDKKYDFVSTGKVSGRYEIVMSDIKASNYFKIDKHDGHVYQLQITEDKRYTWWKLEREYSANDSKHPSKENYQFCMSGLAVRYSYLMNVNTGTTWVLVQDKDGNLLLELTL